MYKHGVMYEDELCNQSNGSTNAKFTITMILHRMNKEVVWNTFAFT